MDRAPDAAIESPRPETARDESTLAGTAARTEPESVDEAIRVALKAATDAGEWVKARALLDVLDGGADPSGADPHRPRTSRRPRSPYEVAGETP
jgi:hypothetical protein